MDLMTPFDLQQKMLARSAEVDTCIAEYRAKSVAWVEAQRTARIAVNTALLAATGPNAQERKAKAEQSSEALIYAEEMAKALRDSALEALRAKREQLNALNALAYTIRTEMQLAR
jgi:hypothetical protein